MAFCNPSRLECEGSLGMRVRYFSDGLVLGSKEFVENAFNENRDQFGPKRKDGARKVRESNGEMFALRRLRKEAVG